MKYLNRIKYKHLILFKSFASIFEKDMGLYPGTLNDGFDIRKVSRISNMQPRRALSGNHYFLGPGQHLLGGLQK